MTFHGYDSLSAPERPLDPPEYKKSYNSLKCDGLILELNDALRDWDRSPPIAIKGAIQSAINMLKDLQDEIDERR